MRDELTFEASKSKTTNKMLHGLKSKVWLYVITPGRMINASLKE